MPQPIQGPTLADVATQLARNEKELKNSFKKKGKISKAGQAELDRIKKLSNMTGATQRERGRQRAIFKEMRKYQLGKKGAPSTKRYNSLFKESDRIATRARQRAEERAAVVARKAAKAKDARKKAAKKARAAQNKLKKAAKAKPAKKVAKKAVKKVAKARPAKKAAKRAR